MAFSVSLSANRRLDFSGREVTGAVGDTITVLPLVIAMALLTDISLPHVLLAFGAFQIVWGIRYGLPISVEPMKALAALVIAGALTYAELAAAGLLLGAILLLIGVTGALSTVERWIGDPVIRGVQLAVALLLVETGLRLAAADVTLALAGVAIAVAIVAIGFKTASALVVLVVGGALAVAVAGLPSPTWPGAPPVPSLQGTLTRSTVDGVFAQLAMTIGNAALATSLLVSDLFDEEVSADELSTSMGVTNLLAIPAGGIPMCHGCDGVAGKYEFGARTGGANVVLGVCYVGAAFFATAALLGAFPLSILGVLLAIVALSLAKSAIHSTNLALSVGVALLAMVTNLGLAFVVGVLVYLSLERLGRGV